MTIEHTLAVCTAPGCRWTENDSPEAGEPTADVHAADHHNQTGHRVLMNILAHV